MCYKLKNKIKFVLWLKSVIVTIVCMLIVLEIFIVSNEARKLMFDDSVSVSFCQGAFNCKCGSKKFQFGPSIDELTNSVHFFVNKPLMVFAPFNFIGLAEIVVNKFSL